ncbi:MAG: ABC transporter ATP-binding protein [Melioribacteraceae bacterium]
MIIKANEIRKSYTKSDKKKLEILKGVSLEIPENKITVIVGVSGAGKSTLLHILSGLDNPDSGEVFFDDANIFSYSDDKLSKFRNENIGFIFQFHHLLPEFTAVENIAMPLMIKGESKQKAFKKAEEFLSIVGLEERGNHKPAELSGGEQQRVAIARALINNPKIIFADEPTGNLDSQNGEQIHSLFISLKEKFGLTFLIVSHNAELIKLGDYIYEMKDGIIIDKRS